MTAGESEDEVMWILFAFGSAVFAGLTSILAKCGIRKTDSDAATAIRTIVVLIFSWIMVMITGSIGTIGSLSSKTWMFLILSGIATGASWLCYFKALQLGDVNKHDSDDHTCFYFPWRADHAGERYRSGSDRYRYVYDDSVKRDGG